MELLLKWFGEHSSMVSSLQIVLDLALVAILIMAVVFGKRLRSPSRTEGLTESFAKIVDETRTLAAEFDSNLKERQVLIQQILVKLDHRMNEARQILKEIEALRHDNPSPSPAQGPCPSNPEVQRVLQMAHKGLDARAIAGRLQKPLGEVELILNLERLSSAP